MTDALTARPRRRRAAAGRSRAPRRRPSPPPRPPGARAPPRGRGGASLAAGAVPGAIESWVSLVIVAGCVVFVVHPARPGQRARRRRRPRAATWAPTCGRRPTCATTCSRRSASPAGPPTGTPASPRSSSTWCSRRWRSPLLSLVLPYGVAFKLVADQRRADACRCRAGRSASSPACRSRPRRCSPSAATAFLFDRSFSIYGGNIASTLAGEFAFSISLSFARALPRRGRSGPRDRQAPGAGPRCCSRSPGSAT